MIHQALLSHSASCGEDQAPVVRTSISGNPGIDFKTGLLFPFIKSTLSDNFLYFFGVSNHQIVGKENWAEFVFLSTHIWVQPDLVLNFKMCYITIFKSNIYVSYQFLVFLSNLGLCYVTLLVYFIFYTQIG